MEKRNVEWQGWIIDPEANATLAARSAVERATQIMFFAVLEEVPRDTGELAESHLVGRTQQFGPSRFSSGVLVDTSRAPYYIWVIRGISEDKLITPSGKKFKVFEFGNKIFSSYVLKARPPNPYHQRAFDKSKGDALNVAGITFTHMLIS